VFSAVALASVRATLRVLPRLLRSGECYVFRTNVNVPRMMSPTMSAGRGCWPPLGLISDSTSRRKALRFVACSSTEIGKVEAAVSLWRPSSSGRYLRVLASRVPSLADVCVR